MEKKFWIEAWEEGRTGFNQQEPHPALEKYLNHFGLGKDTRTLVPLCGKSVDLLYLAKLGFDVHGVELYEKAVAEFFVENQLPSPQTVETPDFKIFSIPRIHLSVGDFFKVSSEEKFDFIYDRASIVALPEKMRSDYAKKIAELLKPEGQILLIAYDYDQSEMQGPPFSVSEKEITDLFKDFAVEHLGTMPQAPGTRLSQIPSLKEHVYSLRRRS